MAKEIYNDEQLREKIMAAARAAVREGIMPGGGVAFLHVLPAVEAYRNSLEGFEASPEELLAEAEAMARRQNTTVEMVQSFFGKDLAGLTGDVKRRKAKEFLYSLATEG